MHLFYISFTLPRTILEIHLGARHLRCREDEERGRHSTCSGGPSGAAEIHWIPIQIDPVFVLVLAQLCVQVLVFYQDLSSIKHSSPLALCCCH